MRQTAHDVVVLLPDGADAALRRHFDESFAIAIGGTCGHPSDIPRSHREARLAQRFARQFGSQAPGSRSFTHFDDLGVYQLFGSLEDASALDGFVRNWLGTLLDYDDRRGLGLVSTLASFLEHGGNYDQTAADLLIGRSTLRYRLHRIAELSGHDLGDPRTRFQLQLATSA